MARRPEAKRAPIDVPGRPGVRMQVVRDRKPKRMPTGNKTDASPGLEGCSYGEPPPLTPRQQLGELLDGVYRVLDVIERQHPDDEPLRLCRQRLIEADAWRALIGTKP